MNATATHPLQPVKAELERIARRGEPEPLSELLAGRRLPAMGGPGDSPTPVDLIQRALELPPWDADIPRQLARPAAELVRRSTELLRGDWVAEPEGGNNGGADWAAEERYLDNLLGLAASLPAEEKLFAALVDLHQARGAWGSQSSDLFPRLRQALIHQQTDDRLEDHWLSLMAPSAEAEQPSEFRKGRLLAAWKGLLWIPPSAEGRRAGRTLSIDRIERGLLALHGSRSDPEDRRTLVRHALHQLCLAFPRSQQFWRRELAGKSAAWPAPLRALMVERWPDFAPGRPASDPR